VLESKSIQAAAVFIQGECCMSKISAMMRLIVFVVTIQLLYMVVPRFVAEAARTWGKTDHCEDAQEVSGQEVREWRKQGFNIQCDAISLNKTIEIFCRTPTWRLVPGVPGAPVTLTASQPSGASDCGNVKGKPTCVIDVPQRVRSDDFESQEEFEAMFPEYADQCHASGHFLWLVFFPDVRQIITVTNQDNEVVIEIDDDCIYPFPELQVELANNNRIIRQVPVTVECTPH
jgi:hypothetical protein